MGFETALLQRTAASLSYPETPALRDAVLGRISAPAPRRTEAPRRFAPQLVALASAVVVAAGAALAVPSSRDAIADFFGIERSRVERLPTPAPGATATPLARGSELPAGARESTLEDAGAALGFAVATPPALGAPRSVYVIDYPDEAVVILRYEEFDLWQAQPRGFVFAKGVPEGVVVLDLTTIGGRPLHFIAGGPHVVQLFDGNDPVPGSERVVERNTLVFNTGRAFYRIETHLPRSPELLRIVDSLP
jgi:hypothetical protein